MEEDEDDALFVMLPWSVRMDVDVSVSDDMKCSQVAVGVTGVFSGCLQTARPDHQLCGNQRLSVSVEGNSMAIIFLWNALQSSV